MDDVALGCIPLFASLPRAALRQLGTTLAQVELLPDAVLFREGEQGDRFFAVLAGELEVFKEFGTPEQRLLRVCGPGEVMGEMGLLNRDALRTATVRARTATRLVALSYTAFELLLQRHPQLAYELARILGGRLRGADDATIRDLKATNSELRRTLADLRATQAQLIEQEALSRELALARRMQEHMLPRSVPQRSGWDFGVEMVPARAVGGDFFDFIPLGTERLGIVVGDAAGKGVPAALLMALTRSLLRVEALRAETPAGALASVNQHLYAMNDTDMFVTMLYGVLDQPTRAFTYARAGHELPLLVDADGRVTQPAMGLGEPVGIYPAPALDMQTMVIPRGGTLLLFTDGVLEARDAQRLRFGQERLEALLRSVRSAAAQVVCGQVLRQVGQHAQDVPQYDDMIVLAVQAR